MGSPNTEAERNGDENQHLVNIAYAICVQVTEVTQGQYESVMDDNPSYFGSCGAKCPVEQVTWNDAVQYANALSLREGLTACYEGARFVGPSCTGYRLPTEAEWEYSARAGTTRDATDLEHVAWFQKNSNDRPHPVQQKQPNAWGIYDMLGNVWEWTGDWYGEYGTQDGDSLRSAKAGERSNRGGSWYNRAQGTRVSIRGSDAPGKRNSALGFRLVRTAP